MLDVDRAVEPRLRLTWDVATRKQWRQWTAQAGQSNLLQSWAYSEAKAASSGWQVKRGVFHREDEPIALVAVLQKRVADLICISRINRGPLLLRPLLPLEQHAVWDELARLGNIWRGHVLNAAPELDLSGAGQALMAGLGFRRFSRNAWESVWLDLGLDLDALQDRMTGKWRRWVKELDNPGKKGISLEVNSDATTFDWMLDKYEELLRSRNFTGPAVSVVRGLRAHLEDDEPLLVFRALHDGEPVSGICVAVHGASATYLLGWNGPVGRKLSANQFLFWFAVKYLKQSGLRWFDLGGISEARTPGITAFKLGLGGERYKLVGEYWKW